MQIRRLVLAATAALAMSAGMAMAKPMSDAAFDNWTKSFLEQRTKLAEARVERSEMAALYNQFLDRVDVSELRPSQIAWLQSNGLLNYSRLDQSGRDYTDEAKAVVAKFKDQKDAEGAIAAALLADLQLSDDLSAEETTTLVRAALTHPGLDEALQSGDVTNLNSLLAYRLNSDTREDIQNEYLDYVAKLPNAAPAMTAYTDTLYERIAAMEGVDEARLEKIRLGLMALSERAQAAASDENHPLARNKDWYASIEKSLEMAPKIAKLVGNTAPELDFTWTNADGKLAHLADVRGKVVVLDFWATWCGPCVASFPNVRKLVEHYDGYPVEVIGVTSLQGATSFRDDRGRVTAETPEEEYAQMKDYIESQDITWTVAFTKQEVFNPDYGVRGIPHLVIIDPEGAIRHRALHPAMPLSEKTEMINAILTEFDMPTPAPVVADADKE